MILDYYYKNIIQTVLEQFDKFYLLAESDYSRAALYKYLLLLILS